MNLQLRSRGADFLLPLLPAVAACTAMGTAIFGKFLNWDDSTYLLDNPLATQPLASGWVELLTTPNQGYAIPVTTLFHAAEYALFGWDALCFHATSLLLHSLIACCIYCIGRQFEVARTAALLAASLFAVHPLAVEPVAWITGQKDLLATLFLLLAVIVRLRPHGCRPAHSLCVLLLCALAIGSKPNAMIAVCLVATADWSLRRNRPPLTWALYALIAAFGAASILSVFFNQILSIVHQEPLSLDSLISILWTLSLQIGHIVFPVNLSVSYVEPSGGFLYAQASAGGILVVLWLTGLIWLVRRRQQPEAFALLCALFAYLPVSQIIRNGRGPADSFMYLPMSFAAVMLAAGLARATRSKKLLYCAAVVTILGLTILSTLRVRVWSNSIELWANHANSNPDDPQAFVRLGQACFLDGDTQHGIEIFEFISERYPEYWQALVQYGSILDSIRHPYHAEAVFAQMARRSNSHIGRALYAYHLINHAEIWPSDLSLARRSVSEIAPTLAQHGEKPTSLQRIAILLYSFGEIELANATYQRWLEIR